MKRLRKQLAWATIWTLGALGISNQFASGAEVLVNGNLEESVAPLNWTLQQTVTGLPGANVNASEHIAFANNPPGDPSALGMFLRPFAGNEGTYAGQNQQINFILSQTIAVGSSAEGKTWTLGGDSYFGGDADILTNDGYPGGVTTLDAESPSGAVDSPTETVFQLDFRSSVATGSTLLDSVVLDLRDDRTALSGTGDANDAVWYTHSLAEIAPVGTRQVVVTAAATNMVANTGFQNAYLDNFTLFRSDLPASDLLNNSTDPVVDRNGDLNNVGAPLGYTLTEAPTGTDTASFRNFADHTHFVEASGEQGLWLRAFETMAPEGEAHLTQTVPGTAGADYTFSAWSAWEANYSGGIPGTPTETFLKMEFLDSSENVIGTPLTLDLQDAGQVPDDTPDGVEEEDWRQFSLSTPSGGAPTGTAFVRVTAGATGMFANVDPQQSGFFDDLSLIETLAGLPGDFNQDGKVDAGDYVVWRKNVGSGTPLPNDGGLGTPIGTAHYNLWASSFGDMAGSGSAASAAVPEPAAYCLALMALVGGAWMRRRGN